MEKQIKKFLEKKYHDIAIVNYPDAVWHYTDVSGLKGIIRDDPKERDKLHFWFTRYDYLNDSSEGVYAIKLFRQICLELKSDGKIDENYYHALEQIDFSLKDIYFYSTNEVIKDEEYVGGGIPVDEMRKEDSMAYVCSFSANEDSLDMWRYYSKGNGGYALKVNSCFFDMIKNDRNTICKCGFYEVVYDKKRQSEFLKGLILDSIKVLSAMKCENPIEESIGFIISVMKMLQFLFKHECFSTEKEYRCVITIPKEKIENANDKQFEVKYRNSNGVLVPYIDVSVATGAYFLGEIKISPFLKKSASKEVVESYIQKCGFDFTTVTMSDLPVRN